MWNFYKLSDYEEHSWASVCEGLKDYKGVMQHLQRFDYSSVSQQQLETIKSVPLLSKNENTTSAIAAAGFNELLFSIKAYYTISEA